jgi:hypothetical protein
MTPRGGNKGGGQRELELQHCVDHLLAPPKVELHLTKASVLRQVDYDHPIALFEPVDEVNHRLTRSYTCKENNRSLISQVRR